MRVGFDIDGVLADFISSYVPLIKMVAGRDIFPAGFETPDWNEWNYERKLGYTKDEVSAVWRHIEAHPEFWTTLGAFPHVEDIVATLRPIMHGFVPEHRVYFVTHRPENCKGMTELWLGAQGFFAPEVYVSGEKGEHAKRLGFDVYFEDKVENIQDVVKHSPETQCYLVNGTYNAGLLTFNTLNRAVLRIDGYRIAETLRRMLDRV